MEDLCAQHLSGFGTHSNHAGTEDRTHSVGACSRPQTDAFQTSSRGLLGCRSSSRLLCLPRMKAWANFKQPGLIWGWHCVLRRAPLGDGSMPILQSAVLLASMADTVRPSSLRIHHPAWGSHRPRQRDSPCHSIHDLSTQYIYKYLKTDLIKAFCFSAAFSVFLLLSQFTKQSNSYRIHGVMSQNTCLAFSMGQSLEF